MNTTETIKRIDQQIALLTTQRAALVQLGDKLADLNEDVGISVCNEYIDFDGPTRAQVVKLITHLKTGKWNKEPGYSGDRIHYTNDTFIPGVKLRLCNAKAPASCRLVEEEVIIPARPERKEKRMKLVCRD